MEGPNTINHIPEESQEVANQIRALMLQPADKDKKPKATDMGKYRNFCVDFLNEEDPISDDVIENELELAKRSLYLRGLFPENHHVCATVIPCSRYGNLLEDTAMADKKFYVRLIIDAEGKTVSGFTSDKSFIFDLQPAEIQSDCTFDVGSFEVLPAPVDDKPYPYDLTPKDRARVLSEYERVLKNAQQHFRNIAPKKDPPN